MEIGRSVVARVSPKTSLRQFFSVKKGEMALRRRPSRELRSSRFVVRMRLWWTLGAVSRAYIPHAASFFVLYRIIRYYRGKHPHSHLPFAAVGGIVDAPWDGSHCRFIGSLRNQVVGTRFMKRPCVVSCPFLCRLSSHSNAAGRCPPCQLAGTYPHQSTPHWEEERR